MIRSVFLRALPLMATALLSSCYENINLDHLRPTPEVVLNCVLSPDEPVRAEVMHTLFLTDEKKNTLPRITDARVQAVVNDSQVFPMVRDTVKGYFEANYVPRPGDRIRIEADTRYGRAVGEDRLPQLVPIDTVKVTLLELATSKDVGGASGDKECRYQITFQDPPGERNYYFVRVMGDADYSVPLDYSQDEVFSGIFEGLNGLDEGSAYNGRNGMAFSDALFNGKRYTLRLSELFSGDVSWHFGREGEGVRRKVQLYSISEGYFRYLSGIFNEDEESFNRQLVSVGLSEPPTLFTNVKNGTGIVGSLQLAVKDYRVVVSTDGTELSLEKYVPRERKEGDFIDGPSTIYRPSKR